MTSLLCRKSKSGRIRCENASLMNYLLNDSGSSSNNRNNPQADAEDTQAEAAAAAAINLNDLIGGETRFTKTSDLADEYDDELYNNDHDTAPPPPLMAITVGGLVGGASGGRNDLKFSLSSVVSVSDQNNRQTNHHQQQLGSNINSNSTEQSSTIIDEHENKQKRQQQHLQHQQIKSPASPSESLRNKMLLNQQRVLIQTDDSSVVSSSSYPSNKYVFNKFTTTSDNQNSPTTPCTTTTTTATTTANNNNMVTPVQDNKLLKKLVQINKKPAGVTMRSCSTYEEISTAKSSAQSRLYKDTTERLARRRISVKKVQMVQHWLDDKLNDKVDNKELYNKLQETLEKREELIEDIDRDIQRSELSNLRKKEMIYKNWYLNVYEPIKNEIFKNMNSSNADYAREVRYFKYLEYLNHVNKYGAVFQDDFEPEDYDPIDVVTLDVTLGVKLKDPTTLPIRKYHKEESTILKCMTGKNAYTLNELERTKLPVILNQTESRQDVDWRNWLLDQYNTIESSARQKSSKKCNLTRHKSEYDLNWNRDRSLKTFVSSNNVYVDHSKHHQHHQQQIKA